MMHAVQYEAVLLGTDSRFYHILYYNFKITYMLGAHGSAVG